MAESELAYLAAHDALTGLCNRITFERYLAEVLRKVPLDDEKTAILLVDLDDFKPINDSYGHAAGDAMLKTVAERLTAACGEHEMAVRLGGDEFVLVWHFGGDARQVERRAETLLSTLRQPVNIVGMQISCGASLGIAIAFDHGGTVAEMLAAADDAMYRAKQAGKDASALYNPELGGRHGEREALCRDLRRAFSGDEFVLHYQPIVNHTTGKLAGYEALVRWQKPGEGLLGPAAFLPNIAACGMMVELTEVVLDRALRQAASLHRSGSPDLFVSVNFPQEYLILTDLTDRILTALAKYDLPARTLLVEVMETVAIGGQSEIVNKALGKLKAMGVHIAFDDFGIGQASLIDLRLLTVDTIKIDREFVKEIDQRPEALKIVQGIVALANTLDKRVIVEGIETENQHLLLANCCDIEVQGFFYGRPAPLPEMAQPSSSRPKLEVVS